MVEAKYRIWFNTKQLNLGNLDLYYIFSKDIEYLKYNLCSFLENLNDELIIKSSDCGLEIFSDENEQWYEYVDNKGQNIKEELEIELKDGIMQRKKGAKKFELSEK